MPNSYAEILLPEIRKGHCHPFVLAGFGPVEWDHDYAPWPVETPDGRSFGSGADAMIAWTKRVFLPSAHAQFNSTGECFAVGYSLGGLTALYAAAQGDWAGCGSCSGSLWYPGFLEWLEEHPVQCPVYLSLGGKEKNTRDLLMARVEECTQSVYERLRKQTKAVFVHEPGGHFRAVDQRLCRAILWLMDYSQKR